MPLRAFTPTELMLTERKRLERPLLLMIWIGVVAFNVAEGGWFYVLAGTLAVAVNALAAWRAKEVFVRRLFVNTGVVIATGVLVIEMRDPRTLALVAIGHYLILIQLCKLFERKTNRDYVQMLVMSMLLMMAGAIICDSLWFAVVLVLYMTLACHTTIVFTLKRGLDAAARARLATEPAPLAVDRVAWNVVRDWPGRAIRWRVLTAMIAILGIGGAIFLIAPRGDLAAPALLGLASGKNAVTGYSGGDVRLGRAKRIQLSDRIVMSVRCFQEGRPAPLPSPYLRGQVFDHYSRSEWSRPEHRSSAEALSSSLKALKAKDACLEVTMEPSLAPVLFACYPSPAIESLQGTVHVNGNLESTISLSGPPGRLVSYVALCWTRPLSTKEAAYLRRLRALAELVEEWRRNLEAYLRRLRAPVNQGEPERPQVHVTPRVRQLAEEWCRDLLAERKNNPARTSDLNLAIAERIRRKLQERCTYSLDLTDANENRDGVEDFLFYTKRGHCEYFASAMTAMCCSLDVRARLAAGFKPDEAAPGEECVVRDRDAHAWTEVYTPEGDWVVFDATPAGAIRHESGLWSGVKDFWQRLSFLWNEKVVSYDTLARQRLWDETKALFGEVAGAVTAAAQAVGDGFMNLLVHGQIDSALLQFAIVLGSLSVSLATVLVIRLVRRRLRQRREERRRPALTRAAFILKFFRSLERRGLDRSPGQTLRETAAVAAERFKFPAGALAGLADLYYRIRWGRSEPPLAELQAAEGQVAHWNEELTHGRGRM